ncbi:glycosyltransferase family 4 protein [Candidatus Roizmanbacteria bacterium]|nr:glycosyltransferase family 4 protein [Candidatus Roizmanbacteria bacterium]
MKKKLKIAMFFSSDPSAAGGVQEHIYNLSKILDRFGHKIDIYGPEKNILQYLNYNSISKSIKVPIPNGSWSNITVEKENNDQLIDKINQKNYDIIHIHEPYIPFVGWEIMKKTRSKKVATFHSAWEKHSIISFINPFITLFQDTFSTNFSGAIFVSKIVKERWDELCGKAVKQRIIHNGVDKMFYPIKKQITNDLKILFLGRLVEKKGPKFLLKAFYKIIKKFPKLKLIFVGKGEYKKSLENYIKDRNLEGNVIFEGEIIGRKRVKYYQQADIFCAPYSDEAFGITVLEAMATGTPIVGFKNSAFKEIFKNYPYPELLVKSRDVDKLARALEKIIKDKNMRQKTSSWLLKEGKKYRWEKIAKETEEFYYKVLNKNE